MRVEDVLKLELRNAEGDMVPLSQAATAVWPSSCSTGGWRCSCC
ncbi:hypothetical protein [Paracoccus aminovorans]|nr:hypothetical protein [Paracoccus aminovorans]